MWFFRNIYLSLRKTEARITRELHANRILQGKQLAAFNEQKTNIRSLDDVEFKVFSQWGDDGIIQYLVSKIDIPNKTFVEFGVENYTEANTRFLLMNNNWSGLIMDGSEEHMRDVKNDVVFWKYDLQCRAAFITAENVNELIESAGFHPELGLLHIDIDGNDYWVWKAVNVVNPIIVIVEYNSVFGDDKSWSIPYRPDFYRTNSHYSNLYFGASLLSFCDLAEEKGYAFVGCNSAGNNAYFVRKDKLGTLQACSAKDGYRVSTFKESRDQEGKLTFKRMDERLSLMKGCEVINTRTGATEVI